MLTPVGISVTRVTSNRRRISSASVCETATMCPEARLKPRSFKTKSNTTFAAASCEAAPLQNKIKRDFCRCKLSSYAPL